MGKNTTSYMSFRVGHQWYGVSVNAIIEVLHLVALTELPAAPEDVLGLLTLRDMVMPVVDLRLRFGLPEATLQLDSHLIALRTPSGPVAVVVDDVDDVEQITEIATHQKHQSPYVEGVARLSNRLLLLLDATQIRQETAQYHPEYIPPAI